MTEVVFYTHVPQVTLLLSKLVRKIQNLNRRAHIVAGDQIQCERITMELHSIDTTAFLGIDFDPNKDPHELTPVTVRHNSDYRHNDIMINLTGEVPDRFSAFRRLIEVVTQEDDAIQRARERYRWYQDRGYPIVAHKMTFNTNKAK